MALAPARIDWRWAQAAEATEFSETQALHRIQSADQRTRDAYRFKRAVDSGFEPQDWPDIAAAYELFTNRPRERLAIEGMLLAQADDLSAAAMIGCGAEDVSAYHDLFFDVRPQLGHAAWVVGQLFQGGLYAAFSPRDVVAQMHRVAWLGGPEIFQAYYTGKYDDTIRSQMVERIRDLMSKQTLLAAGCVNGGAELNMELLRVFIDDTNHAVANTISSSTNEQLGGEVLKFLSAMPLTVADPTDKRNLSLPAIEPRAGSFKLQSTLPGAKDVVETNA